MRRNELCAPREGKAQEKNPITEAIDPLGLCSERQLQTIRLLLADLIRFSIFFILPCALLLLDGYQLLNNRVHSRP